ncbi:hypothetical protein [Streptosporangium minutum]|uniref:Uncharacterized protein n=1 Tax=Streptosporangium minutum TaxID=569862 RepID=A0A243RHI9_9ACTN|nr:hypothetical protein [Streptosporangium minutum]OUC94260.1 hypothetical protein CA984_23285 [Streptosporangium minutum]
MIPAAEEFPALFDGQAEQWWVPSPNGTGRLGGSPYTDGITEARRPARHRPDPRSALTGEPQE